MDKDGETVNKLLDFSCGKVFFYNDGVHFIYDHGRIDSLYSAVYKSDIYGSENELLVKFPIKSNGATTGLHDFNPVTNELLLLPPHDSNDGQVLMTYHLKEKCFDTLSVAPKNWYYFRPKYSNDFSKIAYIEKSYSQGISKIMLLQNKVLSEIYRLTDKNEWFYFSRFSFSNDNNFLSFSKAVNNQNGAYVSWKTYLYLIDLETKEMTLVDGESADNCHFNPVSVMHE